MSSNAVMTRTAERRPSLGRAHAGVASLAATDPQRSPNEHVTPIEDHDCPATGGEHVTLTPSTDGDAVADGASVRLILGVDDRGRPHASRFDDADPDEVAAAAAAMGMTTLDVAGDRLTQLASGLPKGKLFTSGKAFVPFVAQTLYQHLIAYLPVAARPVVNTRTGKAAQAMATTDDTAASDPPAQPNAYAAAKEGRPVKRGPYPGDWDKIRIGSVMLASAERADGWWRVVVLEDNGDGLFLVKWEDWEGFDPFFRRREQMALLHADYKE